jgi:hypothetical protein
MQTLFPLTYPALALLQNGTGKEATAAAVVVTVCNIGGRHGEKRIGILTGDSDVPGLNAVVKTWQRGRHRGYAWLRGSDAPERQRFDRAVAIVRAAINLSSWPGVRDREEDV